MEVAGSIIKRVRLLKHDTTDSFSRSRLIIIIRHLAAGVGRAVGMEDLLVSFVLSFVVLGRRHAALSTGRR